MESGKSTEFEVPRFLYRIARSIARKTKKLENAVHIQVGNFDIIGLTKEWYINKNALALFK